MAPLKRPPTEITLTPVMETEAHFSQTLKAAVAQASGIEAREGRIDGLVLFLESDSEHGLLATHIIKALVHDGTRGRIRALSDLTLEPGDKARLADAVFRVIDAGEDLNSLGESDLPLLRDNGYLMAALFDGFAMIVPDDIGMVADMMKEQLAFDPDHRASRAAICTILTSEAISAHRRLEVARSATSLIPDYAAGLFAPEAITLTLTPKTFLDAASRAS